MTEDGFALRIDVADTAWSGLLKTVGRRGVVEHRVVLDADNRSLQITDVCSDVRWEVGVAGSVPRLVARAQKTRTWGRSWVVMREWTWRPGAGVTSRTVAGRRLASAEGRALIRAAATDLGWKERAGLSERVGIVAALVGAVIVLAVGSAFLGGGSP
ncbi:hypothetical protein [Cellulomonas soli]